MKKLFFYIGVLLFLVSCENILDIQPTDIISEEAVKNDPALVDAFLNKIYAQTRFQSVGDVLNDAALLGVMSDEMNVFAAWQTNFAAATKIIDENGAHAQAEYWPYANIRSANEIIEILEKATFDEAVVKQKIAEARWLRAFMYFELVKRYGGVPLLTKAQSIESPKEELYVERNSEKEIYDFIATEMDELVNILPDSYSSDLFGKPTKWAAYALKSRAMLYAGSIAKYGSVQLNGLLGISSSEANSYYQKAYDASMQIINNSPHALYKGNPDPVKNYNEIFIKDGNSEVIFAVVYDLGLVKTHSWGYLSMPDGFQTGWGSNHWMYVETLDKYEYKDGTYGKLDYTKLDGKTKFALDDIILNRDPRFLASAYYPEIPWQDGKVYMHSKTIGTIPPGSDWPSVAKQRNRTKTGIMVRKRVNEAIKLPIGYENEEDWIVFRTGEMYLNAAEAAFEKGDTDEAKRLINIIRDRAGMPAKTALTVDDIRNERFVELYIEEHRYWDLRRWRIATQVLNGKGFHGVTWEYYIDEDKYTMKLQDGDYARIRTFADRNYYFPIGLGRRADNPNLVENPGY
jgi:hypothetical protein